MLMLDLSANAQFTYLGLDLGYERMGLVGEGKSSVNQGVLVLQGSFRPFRNIGIGASYSIPFAAKHNFKPKGLTFQKFSIGRSSLYQPDIRNNLVIQEEFGFFLRLFPSTLIPLFFDLRISSHYMSHEFYMTRPYHPPEFFEFSGDLNYPAIPAYANGFAVASRSISPGFSVGALLHVGEHGFFFSSLDIDRVKFDVPIYTLTIESDLNYLTDENKFITIRNDLSLPITSVAIRVGGGIRF
jgi:hypothetical protein